MDVIAFAQGVIQVSYHLYFLAESGYHPGAAIPPPRNGLADSIENAIIIHTGIHSGVVSLSAEVRSAPPTSVEHDWDDVVEVNLLAAGGHVRLAAVMSDVPNSYPLLTPAGPGHYRVRVHASGRDTDIDGVAFEPFEKYLVQVWPAEPEPDVVYKATDRFGAELRRFSPRSAGAAPQRPDVEAAARDANLRAHRRDRNQAESP